MYSMVNRMCASIPIIRIEHACTTSQDMPDVVMLMFPDYVIK